MIRAMTVPFRNAITNCRNGAININISLYIKYVRSALFILAYVS